MKLNITLLWSVGICLLLTGLNGYDINIPGTITSNKIGYLFIIASLSYVLFDKTRICNNAKIYFFLMVLLMFVMSVNSLITTFISDANINNQILSKIIRWIILICVSLCSYLLISKNKSNLIVLSNTAAIFLILNIVFFISKFSGHLINFNMYSLRVDMDEIYEGLTRYANGMLFLSILSSVALLKKRTNVIFKNLIVITYVLFLLILLLVGSRQNILAFTFFWFIYGFVSNKFKTLIITFLSSIILFSIVSLNDQIYDSIVLRMVERTQQQSEDGYARTQLMSDAIEISQINPLIGVGIDNFESHKLNSSQLVTHNDYLTLITENGYITFFIYLSMIVFILLSSRKLIGSKIGLLMLAAFLSMIIVSMNFNTLLREPYLYVLAAILLSIRVSDFNQYV
ncbi:MAG: O-antigen ligase family protein [Vibrionaceae bacterium]|nr:O-antigen ligase family protein [Vibrionaceae bacterium]